MHNETGHKVSIWMTKPRNIILEIFLGFAHANNYQDKANGLNGHRSIYSVNL